MRRERVAPRIVAELRNGLLHVRGYIGIMGKKLESTIEGLGFRDLGNFMGIELGAFEAAP